MMSLKCALSWLAISGKLPFSKLLVISDLSLCQSIFPSTKSHPDWDFGTYLMLQVKTHKQNHLE